MMHAMSEHAGVAAGLGGGVLPFDTFYDQPRPRHIFKMPRVVPDQKAKFESDELFRRLCRESDVKYTGYRDRPPEERQNYFERGCRDGHTEIAFTGTGTNLQLVFDRQGNGNYIDESRPHADFKKEHGKVHLRSHLIMNGVCVRWRGYIDIERLEGHGCLEFDEEGAAQEDAVLREQIERYNQRIREFEEKQRAYRSGAAQPPHLNHHHHHHGHHAHHVTGTGATGVESHLSLRQDPEMERTMGMGMQQQQQHQQQQQAASARCPTNNGSAMQSNLQVRSLPQLYRGH